MKFKDVLVGQEFIHPWAGRMRKIEAIEMFGNTTGVKYYVDAEYTEERLKGTKCSISDITEVVCVP